MCHAFVIGCMYNGKCFFFICRLAYARLASLLRSQSNERECSSQRARGCICIGLPTRIAILCLPSTSSRPHDAALTKQEEIIHRC